MATRYLIEPERKGFNKDRLISAAEIKIMLDREKKKLQHAETSVKFLQQFYMNRGSQ